MFFSPAASLQHCIDNSTFVDESVFQMKVLCCRQCMYMYCALYMYMCIHVHIAIAIVHLCSGSCRTCAVVGVRMYYSVVGNIGLEQLWIVSFVVLLP